MLKTINPGCLSRCPQGLVKVEEEEVVVTLGIHHIKNYRYLLTFQPLALDGGQANRN